MIEKKDGRSLYLGSVFLFLGFLALSIYLQNTRIYLDAETLGQYVLLTESLFFVTFAFYKSHKTKKTKYSLKPFNRIQILLISLYFLDILISIYTLWVIDFEWCLMISLLGIIYTWVMLGWGWLPIGKSDPIRFVNLFLVAMQVIDLIAFASISEIINNQAHYLLLYSFRGSIIHPIYLIILLQILFSISLYLTKYARRVLGARMLGVMVFTNVILKFVLGFNVDFTKTGFIIFFNSLFFEIAKGVPQIYWSSHFGKYIGGDDPEINLNAFYKQADDN